jgi:NADH:ubiquinone oxidoreductase subunit H
MDIGWKWMLPAALINIIVSLTVVTQGLNGWRGRND